MLAILFPLAARYRTPCCGIPSAGSSVVASPGAGSFAPGSPFAGSLGAGSSAAGSPATAASPADPAPRPGSQDFSVCFWSPSPPLLLEAGHLEGIRILGERRQRSAPLASSPPLQRLQRSTQV